MVDPRPLIDWQLAIRVLCLHLDSSARGSRIRLHLVSRRPLFLDPLSTLCLKESGKPEKSAGEYLG